MEHEIESLPCVQRNTQSSYVKWPPTHRTTLWYYVNKVSWQQDDSVPADFMRWLQQAGVTQSAHKRFYYVDFRLRGLYIGLYQFFGLHINVIVTFW